MVGERDRGLLTSARPATKGGSRGSRGRPASSFRVSRRVWNLIFQVGEGVVQGDEDLENDGGDFEDFRWQVTLGIWDRPISSSEVEAETRRVRS